MFRVPFWAYRVNMTEIPVARIAYTVHWENIKPTKAEGDTQIEGPWLR